MQQQTSLKTLPSASAESNLPPSLAKLLKSVPSGRDADRDAARALVTRATSLPRVELDRQAYNDQPGRSSGGLAGWQVRRLVTFIEARLEKPIYLCELSDICKLSTRYFFRAFKRSFNQTPHSYIVRKRLAKAEKLMLTSDTALSEIAILCGFADQAHLSKLFRQQYGQSPAAWRRAEARAPATMVRPSPVMPDTEVVMRNDGQDRNQPGGSNV